MNIKLVNGKVNAILRGFEDLKPPINIEKIAISRGLKIQPFPLGEGVSGVLAIENGKGVIGYNSEEPRVRRRFTIAHELGHYELHRDKSNMFIDKQFIYRSKNAYNPEEQVMEQEANMFASAILMPTSMVRDLADTIDLKNDDAIEDLAKIFDVSVTAMSLRISSLGLF